MRFITESELRQRAKTSEIKQLILQANERLTPGARQYLIDFKIPFFNIEELDNLEPVANDAPLNTQADMSVLSFCPEVEQALYDEIYDLAYVLFKEACNLWQLNHSCATCLQNLAADLSVLKLSTELSDLQDYKPHDLQHLEHLHLKDLDLSSVNTQCMASLLLIDSKIVMSFHRWYRKLKHKAPGLNGDVYRIKEWLYVLEQLRELIVLSNLKGGDSDA